jgi:hypothetical protein
MNDFMKTEGSKCPNHDVGCPSPFSSPGHSCPDSCPGMCPGNCPSMCPGSCPSMCPGSCPSMCPGMCPGFGTSEIAQCGCPCPGTGFIGAPFNGSRKNFSTLFLVILILLLFPGFFNNNCGC